jgi:hypothetical protein
MNLFRATTTSTGCLLLCLALAACGGAGYDDYECPIVTDENVHFMTGDLPPGHPCTQDFRDNAPRVTDESKPLTPGA